MYFEGKLLALFTLTEKENNPIKTLARIENTNKTLLQKHFKTLLHY